MKNNKIYYIGINVLCILILILSLLGLTNVITVEFATLINMPLMSMIFIIEYLNHRKINKKFSGLFLLTASIILICFIVVVITKII